MNWRNMAWLQPAVLAAMGCGGGSEAPADAPHSGSSGGALGANTGGAGTEEPGASGGAPDGAGGGLGTGGVGTGGFSTGGAGTGAAPAGTGGEVAMGTGGDPTQGTGGGAGGNPDYPQCNAGDAMPPSPGLTVDPDVTGVEHIISNDNYVAMLVGPDWPGGLSEEVALARVQDLEDGLRDIVELAGFPAFPEWANGHYLNWVLLNTGIPGATLPQNGGHQGNRWGHMNFESTPHNPIEWSEYEAGGALHECVHALQAELWVYNNQASGWLHEAHDNYLLTRRQALAFDNYTMGYTAHFVLQVPHIPIESMGMFTDGSVAGAADQGASGRTYISTQVRYGLEIFFLSLMQTFGAGFVNCLWLEPETNEKSLFQNMQDVGGADSNGIAIMDFAAKTAILDFGPWTNTMRNIMQGNWNNDYWFYMFPGGDGTSTFRPTEEGTPHHQGRNVIPIQLDPGSTSVTVEFTPDAMGSEGTPAQMSAQFVYRNEADEPVYGPVFQSGQNTIAIEGGARGGIVNLAVAVTHPSAASGNDSGNPNARDTNSNKGFDAQEHFSYQARIVSGGTIAPESTRPW